MIARIAAVSLSLLLLGTGWLVVRAGAHPGGLQREAKRISSAAGLEFGPAKHANWLAQRDFPNSASQNSASQNSGVPGGGAGDPRDSLDRDRFQRGGAGFEPGFGGGGFDGRRTPDRSEFPMWTIAPGFEHDVFTFTRIRYSSTNRGRGWGNRWTNDWPDSDWNFSFRMQEMTSMLVDPNGKIFDLTDPALFDYPFIFMNGVGSLEFSDEEAACLRRYLLYGGFMMVDDFWGELEWENMRVQMEKVFPGQEPIDLPLSHPIFHLVYDLKDKPQVPDIRTWRAGSMYEFNHLGPPGDKLPHFQAYHDHNDRLVALLCHNNDLGDGWEREGENHEYFETFSVPWSYPMGINIVTYAMTH